MLAAEPRTVLGDFGGTTFRERGKFWTFSSRDGRYFVRTDDVAGPPAEFEVTYTFGWFPLQQYLVPMSGGRLQCLSVAWDVPGRRWYSLYPGQNVPPDDWLHWTRPALNWNTMCSQCHSTGVQKRFDPQTDTFRTTWEEISVGCEACHGAGSRHVEWSRQPAKGRPVVAHAGFEVKTTALPPRDLVNLCAPCHSRRSELRDMSHPAAEPLAAHLPTLLVPGSFHADGQILDEDYEVHSFEQSKMFDQGVTCSDCHDVHSGKRHKEGNALCVTCHKSDTYDTAAHHFHKPLVDGKPSAGAACVSCHMPGRNYMVVHFRRDHSLRVPRPDLTKSIGTPNACSQAGCHAAQPIDWVVANYERWYGPTRKPHYGTVLAAARDGESSARAGLLALAADRRRPAIVRATALDLLGRYPGDDATRLLEQSLGDSAALVRRTAADRLPGGDAARLAKNLSPLLQDPTLAVRIEAATRLAGLPAGLIPGSHARAFEAAMGEARSALAFSADMPSGRHNWAILEEALGNPTEAEAQYRKALAIDSQFYASAVNLSLLLNRQGRNAEALELLERAAAANPHDAAAAFNLGLLLAEMGRSGQAEKALRAALAADPELAPAAYNLAVLVGERDPAQAAELCLRAAKSRPAEPKYAFSQAYYQMSSGRDREAIATLESLVAAHPGFVDAVLMLGDLLAKHGRSNEAAAIYDRALAAEGLPKDARASLAARRQALR